MRAVESLAEAFDARSVRHALIGGLAFYTSRAVLDLLKISTSCSMFRRSSCPHFSTI